tara:strand:+ start:112 stop:303 length:192 start_codon:yes stop_codon:yes gene_type:complete
MTLAKDLKKGDKIIFEDLKLTVENVEVSKIAKHGKAKCRLETLNEEGEKKIFITSSEEEIELQ